MGDQIPVITEKQTRFRLYGESDQVSCTSQSGSKKSHDWVVDPLTDLFRTTHKVKTQQVIKSRGQYCGDIDLTGYLENETGPVSLVLDLRITHELFGIRKYLTDYNNNPPSAVSFMSVIDSTSGRLHSEFIRLLFLHKRKNILTHHTRKHLVY